MFMSRCLMYNQPAEWLFTEPGDYYVRIFPGYYYTNMRGAGGAFAANTVGEMGQFHESDEIFVREAHNIHIHVGSGSTTAPGEPSWARINGNVYYALGGANGAGNRSYIFKTLLKELVITTQELTLTPPLPIFQSTTSYDWEDQVSDKIANAAPDATTSSGNGYVWVRKKREITGMPTPGAFEYTSSLDPYKLRTIGANKYFDYAEGSVTADTDLSLSFGTIENPNKVRDVLRWAYQIPYAVYGDSDLTPDDIWTDPPMYAWGLGINAEYEDIPIVYTTTLILAEDTKLYTALPIPNEHIKFATRAPDRTSRRYYMAKVDSTSYLPHYQQGGHQVIPMQREPSLDILS